MHENLVTWSRRCGPPLLATVILIPLRCSYLPNPSAALDHFAEGVAVPDRHLAVSL